MRKLNDVINQMLEVSTNEELNKRLRAIQSDIRFTAPEVMYVRWDAVSYALYEYIPNPLKNEETVKIMSIFSMIPEKQILERFGKTFKEEVDK